LFVLYGVKTRGIGCHIALHSDYFVNVGFSLCRTFIFTIHQKVKHNVQKCTDWYE